MTLNILEPNFFYREKSFLYYLLTIETHFLPGGFVKRTYTPKQSSFTENKYIRRLVNWSHSEATLNNFINCKLRML